MLNREAGLLHELQKRRKVRGLFLQCRNDSQPHPLFRGRRLFPDPLTVMEKAALAVLFGILNIGQLMLNTHPVRQPPQGKAGADEIMELSGAVKGCGVVINVIVDVSPVCMGTDEKLILALCPAHGRFIAEFVCLLRRYLAGRKCLPDLKEQGPALHSPACFRLILTFHQQELGGSRGRIAEVGRHSPQLFWVKPIGKPILHCLNCAIPSRYFVGPDIGCSDSRASFLKKGGGWSTAAAKDFGTNCPKALSRNKGL